MAALASISDIEDRWRPLTAAETAIAPAWLDDASAVVRAQFADIDTRVTAGTPAAADVAGIVARMVMRVLQNPDGLIGRSIDDYQEQRDRQTVREQLYLTDGDLTLLSPVGTSANAFTIRPAYVDPATGTWIIR